MNIVDEIKLIYKELFTVKFLHEGYGAFNRNFISDAISVAPDEATKKNFENHDMGYRFFSDILVCFMRCDVDDLQIKTPYVNFTEDKLLRFYIQVSTGFLNKTEIVAAGAKQLYQFGNNIIATAGMFICHNASGVNDDDLKNIGEVEPAEKCFAVLDIHTRDVINSEYALFNAGDTLVTNAPEYNLIFKNVT